jgi:hypothetical protein
MGGEDVMHHLINTGSMVDGAYTQEQGKTVVEEEEEVGEEEGNEDEEDDDPVDAAAPAATAKGKKKKAPKKEGGSRDPKWRSFEDECLAEAWKTVSIDPISGANQNSDTYWERVKVAFDERKLMDPMFNKVHMDRNPSEMSHHWGIIQQACNKWHGIQQEVMDRQESGTSIKDLVSRAPLLAGWHLHCSHNAVLQPCSCCRCSRCSRCIAKTTKTSNSNPSMSSKGSKNATSGRW